MKIETATVEMRRYFSYSLYGIILINLNECATDRHEEAVIVSR